MSHDPRNNGYPSTINDHLTLLTFSTTMNNAGEIKFRCSTFVDTFMEVFHHQRQRNPIFISQQWTRSCFCAEFKFYLFILIDQPKSSLMISTFDDQF